MTFGIRKTFEFPKYYRTGLRFHETYFYGMEHKKPYEQPNPWT